MSENARSLAKIIEMSIRCVLAIAEDFRRVGNIMMLLLDFALVNTMYAEFAIIIQNFPESRIDHERTKVYI